jgi:murein L,D-transpeptidase YcbB/YkuD
MYAMVDARRNVDNAKLALIANALTARPDIKQKSKQKSAYEQESYRAAAESFGIPVEQAITYDRNQRKSVLSDDFTTALKQFQKQNGLKTTGELDYATLKAKSGANVPEIIANFEGKSQH